MNDVSFIENVININGKSIKFDEKIKDVIQYDNCVVIRTKASDINPTNNLISLDYNGIILWKINSLVKDFGEQTVVSIGKKDLNNLSVVTFNGLKFTIDVLIGKVVEKKIMK